MPASDSARATAWMSLAACRDEDPDLFFPIAATGQARAQMTAAKAVCRRCSVQRTCLSSRCQYGARRHLGRDDQ